MNTIIHITLSCLLLGSIQGYAQISAVFDDFEGMSNIPNWVGDDCEVKVGVPNPFRTGINTSSNVLQYGDNGGQYANVRFEMTDFIDLSINQTFSIKIYIPSNEISGNQPNQVSFKLQNGLLNEPWITQSEIIKPVSLDTWQTVTFDFENDGYKNLDPNSPPPITRSDFNRVVIQVNGENNNDQVLAYIDDLSQYNTPNTDPVFDRLVWSDEFDKDGAVDSEKWFHQTLLPNGVSWFNNEIQHYTDRIENAYVENGILKIVAKKELFEDQGVSKDYTSARLNSKFAFTYGRVEVRAKLPSGVGTWPAIWMLGKNITENGAYWQTQGHGTTPWPACGEIDIMEHWGDNQNYISSAMHTPSSFGATVNTGGRVIPDVSAEFHNYSLVWTKDKMVFSVDGVTHYVYEPNIKNNDTWPFFLDQYILFNVAILPNIQPSFSESALEVDYIRIYQESNSTDVEELENIPLLVYPMPFDDEINIQTHLSTDHTVDLHIYDYQGKLVKSLRESINEGILHINELEDLNRGQYIIQFTVNGLSYNYKLVKM